MESSPNKMNLAALFSSILLMTGFAQAENISNLTVECHGTYEVISAVPYFTPAPKGPSRVIPRAHAGANERIQITSLVGKDCEKLKSGYGIELKLGMDLPYSQGTSPSTLEEAAVFAAGEVHKTYPFETSQTFGYALANGDLPLFPTIHSEYLNVLGLRGQADSKTLYGILPLSELADASKSKIAKELLSMEDYGLPYQGYTQPDADQWLRLLVSLEFKDPADTIEHLGDLVLLFNNIVKQTTQFYTSSPSKLVGQKIAALLNTYGKSKWSSKMEILKRNPALLNEQAVIWSKPAEVLNLTNSEIEEFLDDALIKVQALSKVLQVDEARILKAQYQGAAAALKVSPIAQDKHFDLSPHSEELIAMIQSL